MPVIRQRVGVTDVTRLAPLWEELARELRHPKSFGQPMIREEQFPRTGLLGVTVLWDKWASHSDAERPAVILKAYEAVGENDLPKRIAFAVGYTIPEAIEAGLLPVQIVPLLKPTDAAEWKAKCLQAMKDTGGSTRDGSDTPLLGFQTVEQAEACRDELVRRVPGSEAVWTVTIEVGPAGRATS